MAIPNNNNLRQQYAEEISKYRELELQIKRQWGMSSTSTILILISTTGIFPKSLKSNLKELDLDENLFKVMQKAVLLGTARTVWKFVGHDGHQEQPWRKTLLDQLQRHQP